MITMLQKQEIIIRATRQGQSQRSIAKELGISRKTVSKYLKGYESEKTDNTKKGVITPPKYRSTNRTKKVLTQEVKDYIHKCLADNDVKKSKGNYKQCMAGTDIYDGLIEQGFKISYPTVVRCVRKQKQKSKEVFIRQVYQPGSSSEFDWGYVKLKIEGVTKNLMLSVFTSAYSNHRWAKVYLRQDMPSLLQSHVEYLQVIKGVPKEIVYDNMKTAVAKCTLRQSDKKPTEDLLKISTYYQFAYRFANIAKGNEKGHVEKSVGYIRRKAFSPKDSFDSLAQANEYLQNKVEQLNDKSVKGKSITINQQLEEEQKYYHPLPLAPYDYAIINSYKIDKYHTISIDTNHYSVPETIHTPRVKVKLYPDKIHIYNQENNTYIVHPRAHAKHEWFINVDHYWSSLVPKPGALHRSKALAQADQEVKTLYKNYYQDIPKVFIEVMKYSKAHDISIQVLINITIECKQKCINSPLTSDKIILMLNTLNAPITIPPIESSNSILNGKSTAMSDVISEQCGNQLSQIQQYFQSF
jgi:transposase